jgi:hypothetical protein
VAANKAQQAKTADRRRQAVELRVEGKSWQEIADRLGYDSRGSAATAVRRALEQAVAELNVPLEAHRQLELDRLDAMQNALWDKVLAGDTKAIDTTLRLMDRRAKLLGLDAPQRHELTLESIDAALADVEEQLAVARSQAAEAAGAEEGEG